MTVTLIGDRLTSNTGGFRNEMPMSLMPGNRVLSKKAGMWELGTFTLMADSTQGKSVTVRPMEVGSTSQIGGSSNKMSMSLMPGNEFGKGLDVGGRGSYLDG